GVGCVGGGGGGGGTALGATLAWIVLRFVLDTPWRFEPWALLAGVAASVVLAIAVGFLATWRLLGEKPLPVLRREGAAGVPAARPRSRRPARGESGRVARVLRRDARVHARVHQRADPSRAAPIRRGAHRSASGGGPDAAARPRHGSRLPVDPLRRPGGTGENAQGARRGRRQRGADAPRRVGCRAIHLHSRPGRLSDRAEASRLSAPVSAGTVAASGLSALAVAMGIGRFAFTPILPMMQEDAGVSITAGAWLASANYLGYFLR